MIYSIEFQFKIYEILASLDSQNPMYYTVLDVFNEFSKCLEIEEKYKPVLKKRIRHTLVQLESIKKVEKIETVDNQRKVIIYQFKLIRQNGQ